MTSKRYLGNIITDNPTEPTENYQDSAASGVWSLAEAERYVAAELWPTQGNQKQVALIYNGVISGGETNAIQQINMGTSGNATDFGDTAQTSYSSGTAASSTRAIKIGGYEADNSFDRMEYNTFATAGNSTDFGDIQKGGANNVSYYVCNGNISTSTRGIVGTCQIQPGNIDYITIASTGNSTTFGEFNFGYYQRASTSGTTYGFIAGGKNGGGTTQARIDYVDIASAGNYYNTWGDLSQARMSLTATSSNTRAVFWGGYTGNASNQTNTIDYFSTSSGGNASDFGDISANTAYPTAFSNKIYGYCSSIGSVPPTYTNVIEYVTIASTGNSTDFGDLNVATNWSAGTSDSHGGLS